VDVQSHALLTHRGYAALYGGGAAASTTDGLGRYRHADSQSEEPGGQDHGNGEGRTRRGAHSEKPIPTSMPAAAASATRRLMVASRQPRPARPSVSGYGEV